MRRKKAAELLPIRDPPTRPRDFLPRGQFRVAGSTTKPTVATSEPVRNVPPQGILVSAPCSLLVPPLLVARDAQASRDASRHLEEVMDPPTLRAWRPQARLQRACRHEASRIPGPKTRGASTVVPSRCLPGRRVSPKTNELALTLRQWWTRGRWRGRLIESGRGNQPGGRDASGDR